MTAPRHVLDELGAYEMCLADARRLYTRVKDAPAAQRASAQREYEHALARARELGARVTRELDNAAHAA